MATTTNYGWTTPDDTDLVKDGAAAIRTLGSSVDTTTKNLNPETTTGDIAYRSATANTNTRLALGTAGQVLTVNSGATAPEWATPASVGGMTLLSTTTLSGSNTSISISPSGYKDLTIYVKDSNMSNTGLLRYRWNSDTTSNAHITSGLEGKVLTGNAVFFDYKNYLSLTSYNVSSGDSNNFMTIQAFDVNATLKKTGIFQSVFNGEGNTTVLGGQWAYNTSSAISNIEFFPSAGTFDGGTIEIYGVK
jgi:hypothetical protein